MVAARHFVSGAGGASMHRAHVLPFGISLAQGRHPHCRIWAPAAQTVAVAVETRPGQQVRFDLDRTAEGWHAGFLPGVGAGDLYHYEIEGRRNVPDPASRFNPQGIDGPSEIIDPCAFDWWDWGWRGRPPEELVICEVHVGTFSPEGTFAAMIPRLADLAEDGITMLELMPIATFPGARGWGYDGVLPFAPHPAYGRPEDLKRLTQAAHKHGLCVILDVVYNHFGPQGNFLHEYAPDFFTRRHTTPWGDAIDFARTGMARQFFLHNALYWLKEYHLDGLRLDAIHAIRDDSETHFIDELSEAIVSETHGRQIHLILENHHNEVSRLRSRTERLQTAQWNDDFHHSLHILTTGEADGYYSNYADQPLKNVGLALTEGFVFQGQPYGREQQPRGEPSRHLPPTSFVHFVQNHDQIGNRALGERLGQLVTAEKNRAALAITLLAPQTPMLFMGEEYGARQPFLYFCDYEGDLAQAITRGRRAEFEGFSGFGAEEIPDPNATATFEACKLQWQHRQREEEHSMLQYVRRLLRVRRAVLQPLIPRILPGSAEAVVDQGVLRVIWHTADTTLALLANLSDVAASVDAARFALDGATFAFSTADDDADANNPCLAPYEVRLLVAKLG
jgi:maltooligosyltrehalose trehalohydrolase